MINKISHGFIDNHIHKYKNYDIKYICSGIDCDYSLLIWKPNDGSIYLEKFTSKLSYTISNRNVKLGRHDLTDEDLEAFEIYKKWLLLL
jgi:hypothetical protein